MVSEINQTNTVMLSLICRSRKIKQTNEYNKKRKGLTDTENKLAVYQ